MPSMLAKKIVTPISIGLEKVGGEWVKTNQMNEFIPVNVNPVPNSVLRVFLDFKALNSKPSIIPKPQQFNKFIHHGFTLVEQGGLQ